MKRKKQPLKHILGGPKGIVVAAALCTYEGVASLAGFLGTIPGRDPVLILGLSAVALMSSSITLRSDTTADRAVFGPVAAAFVLADIAQIFAIRGEAFTILNLATGILWLTAAAGALVSLAFRGLRSGPRPPV